MIFIFKNLLSVYLDAVFFPNLREIDFMQEGHRLEYEQKGDQKKLVIKGVVFNEMKGSMVREKKNIKFFWSLKKWVCNLYHSMKSDPSNLFSHQLNEALFPDTIYSHNSGGEPLDIPKLTYQQLVDFHKVHYHPSNSKFLTYGDLPLEQHLSKIGSILDQFDRIEPDTEVPDQPKFSHSVSKKTYGPPSPSTFNFKQELFFFFPDNVFSGGGSKQRY